MDDGEIRARHFSSGRAVRLIWERGRITLVEPIGDDLPSDRWVAPGLLDLQVNGFAGVDFQRDGLTESALLHAAAHLRRSGCPQFFLTLITDDWSVLMARLHHLRFLRERSPVLQSAIGGWHVEGPFLSAEPGFRGAHEPSCMIDPTLDHIHELRECAGADRVLLTLAPERSGALAAISQAVSLGMTVSLGHTNASSETLRQAIQAGARGFTHLGNACPQQLDRHDNILWRVLDLDGLTVSLIPDEVHVSPALFRLVHRVLSPHAIYFTTDAMAAAGAEPGTYSIGRFAVEVGSDQIVRQPGRTNFAGSALRPLDGIARAARMLHRPWRAVWPNFSSGPAAVVGLANELIPGQPANLCLLRATDQEGISDLETVVAGCPQPNQIP